MGDFRLDGIAISTHEIEFKEILNDGDWSASYLVTIRGKQYAMKVVRWTPRQSNLRPDLVSHILSTSYTPNTSRANRPPCTAKSKRTSGCNPTASATRVTSHSSTELLMISIGICSLRQHQRVWRSRWVPVQSYSSISRVCSN